MALLLRDAFLVVPSFTVCHTAPFPGCDLRRTASFSADAFYRLPRLLPPLACSPQNRVLTRFLPAAHGEPHLIPGQRIAAPAPFLLNAFCSSRAITLVCASGAAAPPRQRYRTGVFYRGARHRAIPLRFAALSARMLLPLPFSTPRLAALVFMLVDTTAMFLTAFSD